MFDNAYEQCRRETFRHAKTFYFASLFLSREKRRACYAIYAFCRYIDDLVDRHAVTGDVERSAVTRIIARWQGDLDRAYAGEPVDTPVMIAWADTLRRFRIDRSLSDTVIEGVMSDLRPGVRYTTFAELHDYCYKVASVVGLMTCQVFGYSDTAALRHAVDLGIAMQLTNILRDVGDDIAHNRIYLPLDELRSFGLDESDIVSGSITPAFRDMMRSQITRAHSYYDSADRGIPMLECDSRLTVILMSRNYRRILLAIERNNYDVFSRRASVPLHRKLFAVPSAWLASRCHGGETGPRGSAGVRTGV